MINILDTYNELDGEPIDSKVEVSLSSDKLKAYINIIPPKNGGLKPDLESIEQALGKNNIIYGLDKESLIDIPKNPQYNKNIIVAHGIKPVNGKDETFELLFKTIRDLKPKINEDGTADFYNLEIVENVKKGQVLCKLTPPVEGFDGMTVTGKKIPHIPGKRLPTLLGKNVEFNEDQNIIVSKIDGQVDFEKGKINVNETLYINQNVDHSTGNIKARGNVIIKGTINPGFVVETTGNIEVNESISSATLKAGGNIILRKGAISSNIICEGNFNSSFIENCNVFAKGDIEASYLMNSDVKCGKSIKTVGRVSRIVGGNYTAGKNIESYIIGSPAGVITSIEIGAESDTIDRQQKLLKEIPQLEKKMDSLKTLITLLHEYEKANRLTNEKKKMLDEANFSYMEISNTIAKGKEELAKISESIKARGYGRIISHDTIYAETIVRIGSLQTRIQQNLYNKSLYYAGESINIGNA
ncbi:MAG: DUF342 domain-containing protein [Tissierella sp.]|nr:DUF342 domain-containing protein [Tissierella sp.]